MSPCYARDAAQKPGLSQHQPPLVGRSRNRRTFRTTVIRPALPKPWTQQSRARPQLCKDCWESPGVQYHNLWIQSASFARSSMPCTFNVLESWLCYTILYYTILYYTILYYTILYYTILYYTILYYTILYYTILYYTILYYIILYYKRALRRPSFGELWICSL